MKILLTDEEIDQLGEACPHCGGRLESEVAQAQLKKVAEYLNKRAFVFQPNGEGAVVVISCDWEALEKEAGL